MFKNLPEGVRKNFAGQTKHFHVFYLPYWTTYTIGRNLFLPLLPETAVVYFRVPGDNFCRKWRLGCVISKVISFTRIIFPGATVPGVPPLYPWSQESMASSGISRCHLGKKDEKGEDGKRQRWTNKMKINGKLKVWGWNLRWKGGK